MNDHVRPFRNYENFAKLQLFYYVPATNVIIKALLWLYADKKPIEKNLIEIFRTRYTQNNWKIYRNEKLILEELSKGLRILGDLDLTLLYKIVQSTCDLASKDNIVWTENCPKHRRKELEHLIFTLKNGRNYLAHPTSLELKNITNSDVDKKCDEMKELLTEILQEAGQRSKADDDEINQAVEKMQSDMENIGKGEDMTASMKNHLKNIVLKDLKAHYSDKMVQSLKDELKSYSTPHLLTTDEPLSPVPLNKLLQVSDSQIIIVQGEPGEGKTAMTEFLFKCWMTETSEHVTSLETFDFAFRVECSNTFSRDINKFYEDLLPNATYSFPNTSSISRHFSEYKVLWIIDGFDERTPEFTCFLKGLMKHFPDYHKAIITTRPFMLNELKQYLPNSVVTLSLDKLRIDNILQIIQNMILDNEERESFKNEFDLLDIASRTLLTTPLNLILHIKLWLDDKVQVRGSYTINELFVKTTKLQLQRLLERSKDRGSLSIEDLKGKIKRWFYATLCKISFINILHHKFGIIHSDDVNSLKKGASFEYLLESECLSAFLIKDEGCVERPSYYYCHPLQQTIFGYFFIMKIEKYCESTLDDIMSKISSPDDWNVHSAAHMKSFLHFIVKMIYELNKNTSLFEKMWDFLQKVISKFNSGSHQCSLLHATSIAANFGPEFIKRVELLTRNMVWLDLTDISYYYGNIGMFLEIAHPKKLIFSPFSDHPIVRREYQDILNYAKLKKIECYIYQNVIMSSGQQLETTEIDILNTEPISIVAFVGKMTELSRLHSHQNNLKSVGVVIESESDLLKILQFLNRRRDMKDIKIFVNYDINQPFTNNNLYKFPRFRYYMTKITNSHNDVIDEIAGRLEDAKPSCISAVDLINLSLTFVPRYEAEKNSVNFEIIPPKFLQPLKFENSKVSETD